MIGLSIEDAGTTALRDVDQSRGNDPRGPAAEFAKKFSLMCDEALSRPIIITRRGRDPLVVSLAMYTGLTEPAPSKCTERHRNTKTTKG